MKFIYVILILPLLLFAEPSFGQQTFIINTAAHPPFHTPDQKGIIDRLLKETFGRLGLRLKVIKLPAERALLNANIGIDDGDAFRIAGLEKLYPNLISVPETLYTISFVGFTKKETVSLNGWKSLRPYSVGIIIGWKIFEQKSALMGQVTKVNDADHLFRMLKHGRVDLALYSQLPGRLHIQKNKLKGVRMLQPPLKMVDMFLYLNKKHQGLVSKISATLRAMKADQTYQQIINQPSPPLKIN